MRASTICAGNRRSLGIPEEEIIKIAVKSMGLDELKPFDPAEKVIEYMLDADKKAGNLLIRPVVVSQTRQHLNHRHPVEDRFRHTWVRWVRHSGQW